MADPNDRSEEYRREAAACLEVAERMSLSFDRARKLQMAQHWLDLAVKAEKAAAGDKSP
jgi:hypothetical protein